MLDGQQLETRIKALDGLKGRVSSKMSNELGKEMAKDKAHGPDRVVIEFFLCSFGIP